MKIRNKLIVVTLGTALVASLLVFGVEQRKNWLLVEEAKQNNITAAQRQVLAAVEEATNSGLRRAALVAGLPMVQQALADQNREALAAEFVPGFADLKAKYGVKTFVFHTLPATAFLRVHNPDKHGDDLSSFRQMVVDANRDQVTIAGLERGRAGLSARGITPIFHNGEHVGSVEIGGAFDGGFFQSLADETGYHFEFYTLPEDEAAAFDDMSESTVRQASTFETEPLLTNRDVLSIANMGARQNDLKLNDTPYVAYAFPITDFNGQATAVINVMMDTSEYVAIFENGLREAAVALLLAFALALGLAIYFGGALGRRVEAFTDRMRKLAAGDTSIDIPASGGWHELGDIASALGTFRHTAVRISELALEKEQAEQQAEEARLAAIAALRETIGEAVNAAIAGDFSRRVQYGFEEDGFRGLSEDVNRLLDMLEVSVSQTAAAMMRVADGDLTLEMDGDFLGAFGDLQTSVNGTIHRLSDLAYNIKTGCATMTLGCEAIAEKAQDLSGRVDSQAASVEETAATLEEMTATVKSNLSNTSKARDLAKNATSCAERGSNVVENAVEAMGRIEESATKISDIISVIEGIAFQTNLLALNAAVEAARAGEAGKGFAVVASEVRTLAQRSSEAAKDIKDLIADSSSHVSGGVDLVQKTGVALQEMTDAISEVTTTITDITDAVREQSTGIDEIALAVNQMDKTTQQNATMAEESASRAATISAEARALVSLVEFFRSAPTERLSDVA